MPLRLEREATGKGRAVSGQSRVIHGCHRGPGTPNGSKR